MTFTLKCCALNLVNWYAVVKLFLFIVGKIGIDRGFCGRNKAQMIGWVSIMCAILHIHENPKTNWF